MKKSIQPLVYALVLVMTISLVAFGNRAVTAMSEARPPVRNHTIIIDPGHGGVDGGAVSICSVAEKEYNLQISLRLRDLLNLLGWQTRMIRETDESIYTEGETIAAKKASDLKQRLRITEETKNPVFISIHQNFFPDSRYSGPQVFYARSKGSDTLAQALQKAMNGHLNPGSRRECKQAQGIWLMERIQSPAVLIECGFLSNPREEAKLRSPEYQKKLSCVIAATVAESLCHA